MQNDFWSTTLVSYLSLGEGNIFKIKFGPPPEVATNIDLPNSYYFRFLRKIAFNLRKSFKFHSGVIRWQG
ncbi:hypothetical protein HMF3257_11695 [Spirosoma telluris]|uniref:Uncharacterized protein n=1 Tax=Spirosoma telluris TaxID=2183553 RepID=A0A327NH94_9BACT|nr:hypothetical protein HMF3257_11695 [Spirosoma telluris]